jgi:hypothetical protein
MTSDCDKHGLRDERLLLTIMMLPSMTMITMRPSLLKGPSATQKAGATFSPEHTKTSNNVTRAVCILTPTRRFAQCPVLLEEMLVCSPCSLS